MILASFWELGVVLSLLICHSLADDQTVYSIPQSVQGFNPREYESQQHLARCEIGNASTTVTSSKIRLQYTHLVNPTAEKTLLFIHGWPGLWSIWANQITQFSSSYSLLIPTLRGFGPSTHPKDVQTAGAIHDHTADIFCIMRTAQVSKVVCIGHDWGAQVCWEAARARPDLVEAVAGAVVPYLPSAGPFLPVDKLVQLLPHLGYQLYFARHTESAIEELNKSVLRTVRAVMRTIDSPPPPDFLLSTDNFLGAWENITDIPVVPFFSENEEAYLVEQLEIQGFGYTLEFYTDPNRLSYYNFVQSQGNYTIPQPALHIAPTGDPVADWLLTAKLVRCADFIPRLQTSTIHTAHWPHLERPNEFNAILASWLDSLSIAQPDHTEMGNQGITKREDENWAVKSTGEL